MKKTLFVILSVLLVVACQQEKVIYNTAARADFTIDEETYELGEAAIFRDKSVPATGTQIVKWEWNFGIDANSASAEQNPQYIYTEGGTYTVTLIVTDNNGLKSSKQKDITIIDPTKAINIIWQKPILGAIQNTVSPALSPDGRTIYMIADQSATNSYDVRLFAYDITNGNIKWSFDVNGALAALNSGGGVRLVYASPSVGADGNIYIVARDLKNPGAARKSFVFAISPAGVLEWSYNFGIDANINYITPAIGADGNIYLGHLTNEPFSVTVLKESDGSLVKQIPLAIGVRSGLSLDKNGNVYFCSTGTNGIFCYGKDNTNKFNYNTSFATTGGSISIDSDGTIYTVAALTSGGGIVALKPDGSPKWVHQTPGVIQYGGVVTGIDGTVYANGGNAVEGKISAGVVAINKDGSLKWHFGTTENNNNNVPLVDNRSYIHFVSDKAIYYILKPDGTLFSSKELGVKTFASPVMDAVGKIYIAVETSSGVSELMCISNGAKSYANSSWPMKGQNPQRTGLQQ